MKIPFVKMSGAGNDFVVIDNRERVVTNGPEFAKAACDRRWGIGADGLLLLEACKKAAYRMMYYNADGSYGGMCGNGGRCIAAFALLAGIAPAHHTFEALDHLYTAHVDGETVSLSMRNPSGVMLGTVLPIKALGATIAANFVNTGSPHVVIPTDVLGRGQTLDSLDVMTIGREVRGNERFAPDGTNVNFIELGDLNTIYIRTYERGVEAETLSCGTGSVAAAIIAYMLWKIGPPTRIRVRSGAVLQVRFERDGQGFKNVVLVGPAVRTFIGQFDAKSTD
ncbi:MAG: diaminopimelate epimerase [Ignavibacteria bacterium]|nr:diaminopimelate epimerase [Ignavibacteria bacterium]